jgi:Reverse transcriptase (RNA-dependent DNA polymerase)
LVSVRFAPKDAPHIGKGQWYWPVNALKDISLLREVERKGISLQEDLRKTIEEGRQDALNPQTLWETFKTDITKLAKATSRITYYKRQVKLKKLNKGRKEILNNPNFDNNEKLRWEEGLIANRIEYIENLCSNNQRKVTNTKITCHGERLGGIWSNLGNPKKPKSLITRLEVPDSDPKHHEINTKRMAELTKNYHEKLQNDNNLPFVNEEEKTRATTQILNKIPESQKFPNDNNETMTQLVTEEIVRTAIKTAKTGSATGLDGCPYELWKILNARHEKAIYVNKPSFNIAATLATVFQDIQKHGVSNNTDFAGGWMCPLHKKKDKTKIENYRPITLLNTDHKLLTKALSLQLIQAIQSMVHPDQAGFIKGRSIFNHIRLTKIMIKYAEVMEINGAIVALDQEKAYDKINHEYLWKTLEAFNIPAPIRNTIQSLYENVSTTVMINGEPSTRFKVTRGVRQGDPLSCFLFTLAIEPLACLIRNNPNIKGFDIPGLAEKLAINLFADDTVLYLSEFDSLDEIQEIIDQWCRVSGAKFNKEKTEIIPIGTQEHREKVIQTRKLNPDDNPLDEDIHIAKDGEAIRSLGAWVGNNVDEAQPWEPIIDKIRNDLNRWLDIHPTLAGKKTIIQATVGGRTQFLTKAQGMPKSVCDAINQEIHAFLWEGASTTPIAKETLFNETACGSLDLLNLQSRNEAINIIWLKEYLNMSPTRPAWAYVTDILLRESAPSNVTKEARSNPFLQTWNAPIKGKRAEMLDCDTIQLLKTAKNAQLQFAPLKMSLNLKNQLPAWYHIGNVKNIPQNPNSKCLIETHNTLHIKDLLKVTEQLHNLRYGGIHLPVYSCPCDECETDHENGCENPEMCNGGTPKTRKDRPKIYPPPKPSTRQPLPHKKKENAERPS